MVFPCKYSCQLSASLQWFSIGVLQHTEHMGVQWKCNEGCETLPHRTFVFTGNEDSLNDSVPSFSVINGGNCCSIYLK